MLVIITGPSTCVCFTLGRVLFADANYNFGLLGMLLLAVT